MKGESYENQRERHVNDILRVMKGETTSTGVFKGYLRKLETERYGPKMITSETNRRANGTINGR